MAIYKIKLEDDTMFDFDSNNTLEEVIDEIRSFDMFIPCSDYRGKRYYVNKRLIKMIYPENE